MCRVVSEYLYSGFEVYDREACTALARQGVGQDLLIRIPSCSIDEQTKHHHTILWGGLSLQQETTIQLLREIQLNRLDWIQQNRKDRRAHPGSYLSFRSLS